MGNEKKDPKRKPTDTDTYAHKLALSDFLRESTIRSAIQALKLPSGSRGLDAGCGIGSNTLLLSEAEQISFQEGNVNQLPFDDDSFDWALSVDCVGYAPLEPLPLVKELARVVKPGGSVAILGWSSQQLLPGYPQLEARLNATSAGIAPFTKGKRPELHFLRALGWFRDAGLKELRAQTFVGDIKVPLSDDIRSALISLFQMRWGEPQSELSQEDWEEYQRLIQPESPDFILNLPDYYAFFTYSLFHGKVDK